MRILLLIALLAAGPVLADTAQLHNTAGLAFYYQGDMKAAYDEFVRALELDPNAIEPHFNLGRIYEKQARYAEALEQYKQALSLDPKHTGANEGVGRLGYYVTPEKPAPKFDDEKSRREAIVRELREVHAMRLAGKHDEALARADQALLLFPGEARFDLAAAAALEAKGDLNGAIARLKRAERTLPGSGALQYHLAKNLFQVGLPDEAIAHANRAVELDSKNPKHHQLLADIYQSRGDFSLAFDRLFEAARLSPSDEILAAKVRAQAQTLGLGHYVTGLFYFNQNNWKLAREELRLALESGNLSDEQRAIAQQYLIVSDFSLAEVASSIRQLQKDRQIVEQGFLNKRIGFEELMRNPNSFQPGTFVAFEGWIVSAKGNPPNELVVTTDPEDVQGARSNLGREGISTEDLEFNVGIGAVAGAIDRGVNVRNPSVPAGQRPGSQPVVSPTATNIAAADGLARGQFQPVNKPDFRANTNLQKWFLAKTPRPLPVDARIRPRSRIRVEGKLASFGFIQNTHNGIFSRKPQPLIEVTYVSIQREQRGRLENDLLRLPQTDINTPPGVAGPLNIDFLQLSEVQKKNRQ